MAEVSQPAVSFDLAGKVAVVTGGSRGLGRAICEAYAAHGANVVVASRKEQACVELAEQISTDTGHRAIGVGCHVGRWDDCQRLADRAYDEFGHVDVLVNNAGMSPLYPSLGDVTEDLFDKVIAVNLKGAFRLSVLIGERMAAGSGGSIISVSSIASILAATAELPYAAAKAGLNAVSLGLSEAFGRTVRSNVIMPGAFMTDISTAWDMEAFEKRAAMDIPLRRGGQPHEIVGAALYLASDLSSYTTGSIIKVDGGAAHTNA
ncbi:MAG: putative short-chain dehydrogenase [Acidimicrobiales bacterium]|nr:putative short-chain dehydrogenase [Acidimicrobiales bacterium]